LDKGCRAVYGRAASSHCPSHHFDTACLPHAVEEDLMTLVRRFIRHDRGVTSIEYALIAGLVALAIIVGATALGSQLNISIGSIKDKIPGVP
jgi:pilus assembly protein Flp/PilA